MWDRNRPGKKVHELGSLEVKGHQDLEGLFPAASRVLESLAVLSSDPPLGPSVLVSQRPIRVLLQPVGTAKNEPDKGDVVVVDRAPTRRDSESHP